MSRSQAKGTINVEEYKKHMKRAGVWSSCVGTGTIDEAPQVYKKTKHIMEYLEPTVDVELRLKPLYNFKAQDKKNKKFHGFKVHGTGR